MMQDPLSWSHDKAELRHFHDAKSYLAWPLLHELLTYLFFYPSPVPKQLSFSTSPQSISIQQCQKQQQEQMQALCALLDVDLIEQEMKHGLFGPLGVLEVILKTHYAPMCDPTVDAMMQLAATCATGGVEVVASPRLFILFKSALSYFELMKLMQACVALLLPHVSHVLSRICQPPNVAVSAAYHPHVT